jgi:hypothetical protein
LKPAAKVSLLMLSFLDVFPEKFLLLNKSSRF